MAKEFLGTSSIVTGSPLESEDITLLTVMGWVRIDVDLDGAHLSAKESEVNIFFDGLFSNNTKRICYEREADAGDKGQWATDVDSIKQGVKYHVAIVHDATVFAGSVAKMFINGVENTNVTQAPTDVPRTSNDNWSIANLSGILPLGGLLADFRMYKRAFTNDEVAIAFGAEGGDDMYLDDLLVRHPLDTRIPGATGTSPDPIDLSLKERTHTFAGSPTGVADVFGLRRRTPRVLRY